MAVPEEVKEFNKQLNSILETSLPVSRAKMTAITKAATNARKQYKHIVMLVEKFISKCLPEYKIPGLYVIDSIVRQSRSSSKGDVFGPRFARNLPTTFTHIFKCKDEDIPRVIKVLNLWQKNGTFSTEVIQPLHQLAPQASVAGLASRPDHPQDMSMMQPAQSMAQPATSMMQHVPSMMQHAPSMMQSAPPMMQQPVDMEQSPSPPPPLDNVPPIQHRVPPSLHTPSLQSLLEEVSLDKTLIAKVKEQLNNSSPAQDSPNGEDHFLHQRELHGEFNSDRPMDEERWGRPEPAPSVRESRWGPEIPSTDNYPEWGLGPSWGRRSPPPPAPEMWGDHQGKGRPANYPNLGGEPYHQSRYPPPDGPEAQGFPSGPMREALPYEGGPYPPGVPPSYGLGLPPPSGSIHFDPPPSERLPPPEFRRRAPPPPDAGPPMRFGEWRGGPPPSLPPPREDRWGRWSPPRRRRSSRSPPRSPSPPRFARGRSRSPRRGRSRSPRRSRPRPMSRSPRRRSRSSRSPPRRHSRSPHRRSSRSPRRDGSNEEDALIARKAEHTTVWSTTVWVGRIKGTVQTEELQRMLTKFGRVVNVEVITQRGCVYITMATRRDAEVVHRELKFCDLPIDHSKKGGRGKQNIEVAWAPGRGCKGSSFKTHWVLKQGVTVIPWSAIKEQEDLNNLGDGGEVDVGTLPPGFRIPQPQGHEDGPLPDQSQPPFLPPVGEDNLPQ